jgi:hypothetical protein
VVPARVSSSSITAGVLSDELPVLAAGLVLDVGVLPVPHDAGVPCEVQDCSGVPQRPSTKGGGVQLPTLLPSVLLLGGEVPALGAEVGVVVIGVLAGTLGRLVVALVTGVPEGSARVRPEVADPGSRDMRPPLPTSAACPDPVGAAYVDAGVGGGAARAPGVGRTSTLCLLA